MSVGEVGHEDHLQRLERISLSLEPISGEDLVWLAEQFQIPKVAKAGEFGKRGNINRHTYLIVDENGDEHLLQQINSDVFKDPDRVMEAMVEWIESQKTHLKSGRAPSWTVWKPITLIDTIDGAKCLSLKVATGRKLIWRMMEKIQDTVCCKSLSEVPTEHERLQLAEEMGKGLALNSDFTSDMKTDDLVGSLAGYRDTEGYYRQLHAVLAGSTSTLEAHDYLPEDNELCASTQDLYHIHVPVKEFEARRNDPELAHYIEIALKYESFARSLSDKVKSGEIRKTAIHGDTKIENFLFCCSTGKVTSLVDLDTIMPYTWLADWGDMVRSLCNVAGEIERDLDKVQVDKKVYEAVTNGFLSTSTQATSEEIKMMHDSVMIIALELGIRFLTDYLRGDNYFQLGSSDPADLNKVRAMVQITLFERLAEEKGWAADCISRQTVRD